MATKKKIAEQILRIVQGGNVSDDSSIDIREVMALIDQERDSIIKRDPAARSKIGVILTYPGVKAVFFHKIANFFFVDFIIHFYYLMYLMYFIFYILY